MFTVVDVMFPILLYTMVGLVIALIIFAIASEIIMWFDDYFVD